ncbi:hypothetical protein [Shewanella glacialimarina]|uniref:hypothetical protein n=1 Tax=Shewanella glacialimarina TaxID=2590884 RepID=UPI001CF92036|nr:hypothetical protein [Shewanella glacialimarina]UCX05016.1 hypothetical protein FJ709_11210 [Shewanella glacialimarina]
MPPKHPVPALFDHFGMPAIKPSDEFTIVYKGGMLQASVKRKSGKVETITQTVGGKGFSQMSKFDPDDMSEVERNKLIKKMYNNGRGESQSALGQKFGLRQPQVSRIVNKE